MAADGNSLCNMTFADANATGFYSFPPADNFRDPNSNNVTWSITLLNNKTYVETAFWYNTGGANYSNPQSLTYDVCLIGLPHPSAYSESRASLDNGDCSGAMDSNCTSALESMAASYANSIISNLGAESTNTSALPTVCQDVRTRLRNNFPGACTPFFNVTGPDDFYSAPLTGFGGNASYLYSKPYCVIGDKGYDVNTLNETSDIYWYLGVQGDYSSRKAYDEAAWALWPQLTLFTPIVGASSSSSLRTSITSANLICLRDRNFTSGSRVAAAPIPSTTTSSIPASSSKSNTLSGGAIAGAVVGSLVGFLLLLTVAFFLWRRNKKQKRQTKKIDAAELGAEGDKAEVDGAQFEELPTDDKNGAAELQPKMTDNELPGPENDMKHELDAGVIPPHVGELPANEAVVRKEEGEEEKGEKNEEKD